MDLYLTENVQKRAERWNQNDWGDLNFRGFGKEWWMLLSQSFDIFRDVQSHRAQREMDELNVHSKVLSACSRYFMILENTHRTLIETPSEHQPDDERNRHLELIQSLMLMWKLFQTVFLETARDFQTNGTMKYIFKLQQFESYLGDPLRKMPKQSDGKSTSSIWQTVARFIIIGKLSDAYELLRRLDPQIQSTLAVQYLLSVLEDSPLLDSSDSNPDLILEWRSKIADLLETAEIQSSLEVCQIFRLMLGFFEEWTIVGHEFTSWAAFYSKRLLHIGFFPSPVALSHDLKLLSEARIGCRRQLHPVEIDTAVEAVLRLNWDEALEILRSYFHNTWLSVHMWDLIDLSGTLVTSNLLDQALSNVVREGLIIEYVQVAVRGGSWLPFIHYLKYCESHGALKAEELVREICSFGSEEERRDVLRALEADGMNSAVQLIHQREAISAAKCGDFESAMESANLCDHEFRFRISNMYIEALRRSRGSVEFRNSDKAVMTLLPDQILQRIGNPGFYILYERANKREDMQDALRYLTLLLTRTYVRETVFQILERLNACVDQIRLDGNIVDVETHRQLRTWLTKLPLTNLKPSSQTEKLAVRNLEKEIFKAAAWSFDQFSSYAAGLG